MNLFAQQDSYNYINNQREKIKNTIQALSDTQILNTKLEDLIDYYYDIFYIQPISLYMNKISSSLEKSKTEQYNPFHDMGLGEPRIFLVDSYKINFNIPFDGDENLLYISPSQRILARFPIDGFANQYSKEFLTSIMFSINIVCSDLEKKENPQNYIDSLFQKEFKSYQQMVQYLNNDISNYNSTLRNYIEDLLNKRKGTADKFSCLINKLNIPLKENINAANITPIPLKMKKETRAFPKQSTPEENWCITDNDYTNIKKIISQACTSFEHTPSACQKLSEEELRDMLLANLNTHYNSSATGETFSKVGKTDIRIQFNNKAAYIAECKIWHGISQFNNAINQLFSYTTWRDTKTSLIVFNKEIKDFSSILSKINAELRNHPLKIKMAEISKNEWQCTFRKSADSEEFIELHIIICDVTE